MDGYIGQIIMFGGTFAPRNWAFCSGQLLPISNNTALFSIIGTTYGGDGRSTFALPDMRGRNAVHAGRGPGLNDVRLGQSGGAQRYTLTTAQLPSHEHTGNIVAEGGPATEGNPTNNFLGVVTGTDKIYEPDGAGAPVNMATGSIKVNPAGGSQPYETADPYLAVNYIICLQGIFPSRS